MYLIINLFLITAQHINVLNNTYGGEVAPARVSGAQCNGDEQQLVDCSLTPFTDSNNCIPAGVVCQGQRMKLLVMKV